jgi:hypothetical protein
MKYVHGVCEIFRHEICEILCHVVCEILRQLSWDITAPLVLTMPMACVYGAGHQYSNSVVLVLQSPACHRSHSNDVRAACTAMDTSRCD